MNHWELEKLIHEYEITTSSLSALQFGKTVETMLLWALEYFTIVVNIFGTRTNARKYVFQICSSFFFRIMPCRVFPGAVFDLFSQRHKLGDCARMCRRNCDWPYWWSSNMRYKPVVHHQFLQWKSRSKWPYLISRDKRTSYLKKARVIHFNGIFHCKPSIFGVTPIGPL